MIYIDPPYDAKAHLYGQNISLGLAILHLIDKHNLLNVNGLVLLEGTSKLSDERFPLNQLTFVETRHYGNTFLSIFSSNFII